MADYLWHSVSDKERKKIEEDAKNLILEFGDSLEKIGKLKEKLIDRGKGTREESKVCEVDNKFKELMMENAPNTKDNCIVAEKGAWNE